MKPLDVLYNGVANITSYGHKLFHTNASYERTIDGITYDVTIIKHRWNNRYYFNFVIAISDLLMTKVKKEFEERFPNDILQIVDYYFFSYRDKPSSDHILVEAGSVIKEKESERHITVRYEIYFDPDIIKTRNFSTRQSIKHVTHDWHDRIYSVTDNHLDTGTKSSGEIVTLPYL